MTRNIIFLSLSLLTMTACQQFPQVNDPQQAPALDDRAAKNLNLTA